MRQLYKQGLQRMVLQKAEKGKQSDNSNPNRRDYIELKSDRCSSSGMCMGEIVCEIVYALQID